LKVHQNIVIEFEETHEQFKELEAFHFGAASVKSSPDKAGATDLASKDFNE